MCKVVQNDAIHDVNVKYFMNNIKITERAKEYLSVTKIKLAVGNLFSSERLLSFCNYEGIYHLYNSFC